MAKGTYRILRGGLMLAGLAGLAACSAPPPPPPPAPPPPPPAPVAVIPPRPVPPYNASPNLEVPPVGPDGVRQTVNTHLTGAQMIWNLRSGLNVAALDCQGPQYAPIADAYRTFLKRHARVLTAANRGVDSDFRKRYGRSYLHQRESYLTQVYNYFAFPPTLPAFCDAALAVSTEGAGVSPRQLGEFSARSLPQLEAVFETFFRAYEQYRADSQAWDAKYASVPGLGPNGGTVGSVSGAPGASFAAARAGDSERPPQN